MDSKEKRVLKYVRGTSEQMAHQGLALNAFCAFKSDWIVSGVHFDEMGSYSRPPGLARVKEAIRNGECDVVIVTRADRVSRDPEQLCEFLDLASEFAVEVWTVKGSLVPPTYLAWINNLPKARRAKAGRTLDT